MVTPKTFAENLEMMSTTGPEVSDAVRWVFGETLGETSSVAAISYSGDAQNGDYLGFATRLEELFGENAHTILEQILDRVSRMRPIPEAK